MIFSISKSKVCLKQPIGVTHTSTFFIDTTHLSHRDDIRSDDLGVWKNEGVRSKYCSVHFDENNKVKKVIKMASKPLVMRSSIYRIKQSYWCHAGDKQFLRRLIEVEGMHVFTYYYHLHTLDYKQKRHPICILQYVHPSEANISHRPHKNAKQESNYVRTKKSVLIKVKDEATG